MSRGRATRKHALLALVGLLLPVAFVVPGRAPAAAEPTAAPGTLVSVEPTRLLDTRVGNGAPAAPVAARGSVTVQIAGRGGLPAASQVAAVFLTLTVTQPRAQGYLSARPTGGGATGTSTLNFAAGQTVANSAMVLLGAGGQLTIDNVAAGSSQVVVDVTGYTRAGVATAPGTVVGVRPARLLDTRSGVGAPSGAVRPGAAVVVATLGGGGLPLAGVGGVVLTLTATATTGSGYLAVGPADSPPGQVSNLNWSRTGQTVANQVQTRVDPDGRVVVVNRGGYPVAIVADVQGYVLAGRPSAPDTVASFPGERAADTRVTGGPVDTTPRMFGVGGVTAMPPFEGTAGLPVTAVLVTVTVTRTTGAGYLTVWSGQGAKPTASTSNWAGAGQTVAGLVLVPLSGAPHDQFAVAVTGGRADIVVDVSGYLLLDPSGAPPAAVVAATGFQQNAAHDGHAAGSVPSTATQRWDLDLAVAGGYPEGTVVTVGHPVVTAASGAYVTVHHVDTASGVDGFDLFHVDVGGTVFGPVPLGTGLAAVDLLAADDRVITVDSAGRVAASSLTGEAPWAQVLPFSQSEVGAAAYGGRVFVASATDLWALDTTDGHIVWQVALPAGAAAPQVSADATGVYVSGGAVDTAVSYTLAGAPRWTNALGSSDGSGTPALHHGRLWARDDDVGTGVVLDATSGRSLRAFTGSRPVAFRAGPRGDGRGRCARGPVRGRRHDGLEPGHGRGRRHPGHHRRRRLRRGQRRHGPRVRRRHRAAGVERGHALDPTGSGDGSTGPAIGGGLLLVPNGSHLTAFG